MHYYSKNATCGAYFEEAAVKACFQLASGGAQGVGSVMVVTVNFEKDEFPETELSVSEIIRRRRYTFPHIITKRNGALVGRDQRDTTLVSHGDELEIFHLISGG